MEGQHKRRGRPWSSTMWHPEPAFTQWGCPGSLVAVGGACTTIPDWRCPAERFTSTATVIRLDTARPGWFPPGDVSDEGPGTNATTLRPPPRRPTDPTPRGSAPPEALPLTLPHPLRPPDTRQRDVGGTRNCATREVT